MRVFVPIDRRYAHHALGWYQSPSLAISEIGAASALEIVIAFDRRYSHIAHFSFYIRSRACGRIIL